MSTAQLEKNPMMNHLLDALAEGKDIGHYGRLTFAMIARHFLDDEELIALLAKDEDESRREAMALMHQVKQADYSPPGPGKIRQWEAEQDFPIIPPGSDRVDDINVYQDLEFPDDVYQSIEQYHERQAEAEMDVKA